ncbi:hypothetical protein JCM19294_1133 [Nonlabens tegetincola]|uniref:Uncharacterized protein n=1 Tax=Nonlabens tegetincola TaxID=323273 RepID=A0A090Q158_9FLAO|nr:hypothetical protein [Nonlabens tegetincola]GAK96824.1 hypothetical protein JCM19294_1133 [Nonlabens tegetincola]
MKKLYLQMVTAMTALFATNAKMEGIEMKEGEVLSLSEEQKEEIDKHFGQEGLADKFMSYHNEQAASQDNEQARKLAQQFLASDAMDDDEEEEEDADEDKTATATDAVKNLGAKVIHLEQDLKTAKDTIDKLANGPDNTPVEKVTGQVIQGMKHSKTHLFGSGLAIDAYNNRPWNAAAAAVSQGTSIDKVALTQWGDNVNVQQLNQDIGEYSRQFANEIINVLRDGQEVPSHWDFVSGVEDEYITTQLASGEVTQGWKAAFLPKNKQKFVPIINKIFDIQIDGIFTPKDLKSIEKNYLRMWFNEGSDPHKPRFVQFMVQHLLEKARKEDKIRLFKGVEDKDVDRTVAGNYLNAADGYLKIIDDNRGKTFMAIDTDVFTPENTYDVIQDIVENKIPQDFRVSAGLVLEVGTDVHRWYHDSRERKKGTNTDYARVTTVEKFPNITFEAIPQLEGTGLWTLQPSGNVGVMVDRPGEESVLKFQEFDRNVKFMGDYKMGVFVKAFGAKVDTDTPTLENQLFFCNNVPLLTDVYIAADANDSTPSVADHHALSLGATNTGATNVTKIDDVVEGQYVYLYGDSDVNVSTIVNGANIILDDGDFALTKGNKITLLGLSGGKVIEVNRTVAGTAASVEEVILAADATTANAEAGKNFKTQENTAATAFTNIENAVKDVVYTITGGSDTNATTIAASNANFLLTGDVTLNEGSFIKLLFNGSKFVETARG